MVERSIADWWSDAATLLLLLDWCESSNIAVGTLSKYAANVERQRDEYNVETHLFHVDRVAQFFGLGIMNVTSSRHRYKRILWRMRHETSAIGLQIVTEQHVLPVEPDHCSLSLLKSKRVLRLDLMESRQHDSPLNSRSSSYEQVNAISNKCLHVAANLVPN